MVTKLKDRDKILGLVALLILVAVAVCFVSVFPFLRREAMASKEDFFEQDVFLGALYESGYSLYWKLAQSENARVREKQNKDGYSEWQIDEKITPADVFFPAVVAELEQKVTGGDAQAQTHLELLRSECYDVVVRGLGYRFLRDYTGMQYLAFQKPSSPGEEPVSFGTAGKELTEYARTLLRYADGSREEADALAQAFQYYVVLDYDDAGNVSVKDIHGADAWSVVNGIGRTPYWWNDMHLDIMVEEGDSIAWRAEEPRNMIVAYGVPVGLDSQENGTIGYEQERFILRRLYHAGIEEYYFLALLLALCLGLAVGLLRNKQGGLLHRIPLEAAVAMGVIPYSFCQSVAMNLLRASGGDSLFRLGINATGDPVVFPPPGTPSILVGYVLCFCMVFGLLLMEYAASYSLGQIRTIGPRAYLTKRVLFIRMLAALGRPFQRLFRWIITIDLTDAGDRAVVKIVTANFIVITLFSCFWFFGIIGTVLYSIFLFYFLRRYIRSVKGQYQAMMQATSQMAMGRLDVDVGKDLGIFAPLGMELRTIQQGFREAVENEVKSRSMKTELVANVSHDLKTPLTAIITYIGLLKEEDITEQERKEYIDTLDKKSQRLKRLIEDLFEMSKATTGNLTLNIAPVDLPSLIRQVEMELEGEITASGVEFRNRFSEEKAGALLDGDRTYRVFENLILNVTKYGLSGTRAYVDIVVRGGNVIVKISNVSREPLDFDTEDITERFVRGDRSRGTEGSGLGLAIAKSLVELQGGRMTVSVDGDLFKVTVIFPAGLA